MRAHPLADFAENFSAMTTPTAIAAILRKVRDDCHKSSDYVDMWKKRVAFIGDDPQGDT